MLKTDWNICYNNYDFYIFLKLLLARHYCYASPHKNIGSHREDPGTPKKPDLPDCGGGQNQLYKFVPRLFGNFDEP